MIKKSLIACMLLISMTSILAQESMRISGKVIDALTGEPLAFSHVGIFNSSYGTVSNIDGDFSLIIPSQFLKDQLSASYIGYGLKSIPVSTLSTEDQLVIKLKSTVTELPELVISNREKSIMEEAIEAIPGNHDQNKMQLRAFWRASIWNETDNYVQMTEYAFDMYRHGAIGEEENAMKILRGRVARDTSFFADIGGMQIGVTPPTLFVSSLLKEHPLLDPKVLKKHDYKITDATSYNGRAVFVVSFQPKRKARGKLFEGKILLDTETLAFVKISFRKLISPEDPEKVFDRMSLASMVVGLGKSTMDKYENELNYQFVNGKWYLSHAKYDINWTMRRAKQGIAKPVTFKADFVVTDIQKNNIVVPPAEELASKAILERQVTKNESDFWNEYNYLKAESNFEALFEEILNRN
ncbi:carboxypeptidase-like regulatory domain-containing protein [Ekhidna sp. To15]|uniref:carboxypeptidase-like regulatory domain-containing protein n=1 Tax=Ekhidna sp. To15 TaxID=3395267 RepID=UPI003F51E6E3